MRPRFFPLCVLGAAVVLIVSSCVSIEKAAPPVASLATARRSPLEAGRAIYLGKCTKCHSPEPIRNFSLADWQEDIMPTMSKKSKLTPQEESQVMDYVVAVLKSPPPPTASGN